jgi:hypothetical protein
LLLRWHAGGGACARAGLSRVFRRERDLSALRSSCRLLSGPCRSSGCSSRPTALSLRRSRCAAGGTSPRLCSTRGISIARTKGVPPEEVERATDAAARQLFRLPYLSSGFAIFRWPGGLISLVGISKLDYFCKAGPGGHLRQNRPSLRVAP